MYLKSILPIFCSLCSSLLYPVSHESYTVYLCMRCEVEDYAVLFSMKTASLAQCISEYFIHILRFTTPISIHVLGYMG